MGIVFIKITEIKNKNKNKITIRNKIYVDINTLYGIFK